MQNPKQSTSGIIFKISKILEIFREISLLDLEDFSFHFHFSISISRHSRSMQNPKQSMSGIILKISKIL